MDVLFVETTEEKFKELQKNPGTFYKVGSELYLGDIPLSNNIWSDIGSGPSSGGSDTDTEVKPGVKIVSWAEGTDEEIVNLIAAADAGHIDLYEDAGWRVGDTRTIHLNAMDANYVDDPIPDQTGTIVLMDRNCYELVDPVKSKDGSTRTTCSFVVGWKELLTDGKDREHGVMHDVTTEHLTWDSCNRRKWCNDTFRSAVPESIRNIFKKFKVKSVNQTRDNILISEDYFSLFAIQEICGTYEDNNGKPASDLTYDVETNILKHIEWYKNTSNMIKIRCPGGTAANYWTRSVCTRRKFSTDETQFMTMGNTFNIGYNPASYKVPSISPFGVI